MLNFPSYGILTGVSIFSLLMGTGLSIATFFAWRTTLRRLQGPAVDTIFQQNEVEEEWEPIRLILVSFGSLVFVGVGIFTLTVGNYHAYQFRKIHIASITSARIFRAESTSFPDDEKVFKTLGNVEGLRNALGTLNQCRETANNHDIYSDGYRIELRFDDYSLTFYSLLVFRKTHGSPRKSVVIPNDKSGMNLDEYDCPYFQRWVKENLDPLFGVKN